MSVSLPFWLAYAQTSQEVRVRWEVNIAAPRGTVLEPGQYRPDPMFTIADRRQHSNPMPRQRSPELSADQLLVVAIDTQGQEKEQVLIPDPRVLRAESPDDLTGELQGEVLHHATAEFLVPLPNDPTIAELRFYHPRWTGSAFVLDLLGVVLLP
jgi:hypothetical protein